MAMKSVTWRRLQVIQNHLREIDWALWTYKALADDFGVGSSQWGQMEERMANHIDLLKDKWIEWQDLAEALSPYLNGSPHAWFVNLIGNVKRFDRISRSHAIGETDDLDAAELIRDELSMCEHAVSIALARISGVHEDAMVSVSSVAAAIRLSPSAVRKHSNQWGQPEHKGSGRQSSLWKWSIVRAKLAEQFPGRQIPSSPPPTKPPMKKKKLR